jgi:hypothetical protein
MISACGPFWSAVADSTLWLRPQAALTHACSERALRSRRVVRLRLLVRGVLTLEVAHVAIGRRTLVPSVAGARRSAATNASTAAGSIGTENAALAGA